MTRLRILSLTAVIGTGWFGCGGSESSPQNDGGSQGSTTSSGGASTSGGGSGTSATSTGGGSGTSATGTGGGGTSATGTGGAGTSATGGNGGKAGAGGAGGQPNDASSDAPVQCAGTVTFHMSAANGKSSDYCVGSQCADVWVTVTTGAGRMVIFDKGCQASCADCVPIACPPPACRLPQPMKAQGETTTWDGTDWQPGTCGAQMSCRRHECAAPGKYVAKMCASRSTPDAGTFGQCNPSAMLTCVDVPFDYPSATVVEGMIN